MPRTLPGISDAIIDANELEYFTFVRIDTNVPLRFTDRPGGFTGPIDGSSHTWFDTDFAHGPLRQSQQDILVATWISFSDLDNEWTNRVYADIARKSKIIFYVGIWNPQNGAYLGATPIYHGRLNEGEFDVRGRFSITPHYIPWSQKVPFTRMSGRCTNDYRNPEDCQYTGPEPDGQVTCGKTRQDCRARGNEININIYDDIPKANEKIMLGGVRHGLPPAPDTGD
jgi:hypothetical protein